MFSYEAKELPKMSAGESYVLEVDDDGKISVTTTPGVTAFMHLRAKPAALASIFADKIQEAQQQISMIGGMAAGQMGASPAEVNKLIEDVFAFPKQLDTIAVDMNGSETSGFDGKVEVTPAASGWLATFITDITPNKAGAPLVTHPDALLHLAANMQTGTLLGAMRPFLAFVVGPGAADKDEKTKFTAMMQNMLEQFDGTMSMAIGSDKSQRIVAGLLDSKKVASVLASDDYKTWRQASSDANPAADVEIKDAAATHRDVSMTKQVTDISGPMGDQTTTSFSGIAGDYLFSAATESDAKAMVDKILDDKIERGALPGGALMTLSTKVAELVRTMSGGMADADGAPSKLDIVMNKQGSTLAFTFKVGM